jgi:hypothetical protein
VRAYLSGRAAYRRGYESLASTHYARALEMASTFAHAALDLALASGQPLGLEARCPAYECSPT